MIWGHDRVFLKLKIRFMKISDEKILKYIMLSEMDGIGPATQNALLNLTGDIDRCFVMEEGVLLLADNICSLGKRRIRSFISQRTDMSLREKAETIYEASSKLGIDVIVREDERFPKRFFDIYSGIRWSDVKTPVDLPVVLYVKGSLWINDYADSIGIVGARRCTPEGKARAIDISAEAVDKNAAVISGMAKGIDSYAHTAAIKSGGYTIAVLGSGPDICYPKEHERLYEEISEHGCIISEYSPGTEPREYRFPKRNRLIAALSDRLYVIEAGRNSGTKSTVEKGREYGREVYNV